MDRDLEAEHLRLTHLSTILGNAQLLQRWAVRSSSLTDTEREAVLRQGLAIEQAAKALCEEFTSTLSPTEES